MVVRGTAMGRTVAAGITLHQLEILTPPPGTMLQTPAITGHQGTCTYHRSIESAPPLCLKLAEHLIVAQLAITLTRWRVILCMFTYYHWFPKYIQLLLGILHYQ